MPVVDVEEVAAFQTEVLLDSVDSIVKDARNSLVGRLTALADPAPTDAQLWDELANLSRPADAVRRRGRDEHTRRMEEIEQQHRERIVAWLVRPGSGIDSVTGLAWSQIARYRVIEHPRWGRVPQYVDSARRSARTDASPAELERADLLADPIQGRELAVSMAELHQSRMTWLLCLVGDAAERDEGLRTVLGRLVDAWSDPRVQELLMVETSPGWPPPFDRDA